jgi:hypothetical protein
MFVRRLSGSGYSSLKKLLQGKKLARKKERGRVILLDETKGEKKTVRIAYVTICLDLERRREVNFIKMYEGQFPSLSTIYVVNDALRSCRGTPIIITDHAPLVQIPPKPKPKKRKMRSYGKLK